LVIADLALPDGTGLDLAHEVARRPPPAPVVVAVSGYGGASNQETSRAAGFRAHLVKPVSAASLLAIVDGLDLT
jgi:CheY-like chemotaxis protein